MQVHLNKINEAVHFEGSSKSTTTVVLIDGTPQIGGQGLGTCPMELVLMALGSCGALNLVHLLKKQKQDLKSFSATVSGICSEILPYVFIKIHITFTLSGSVDIVKVENAAALAVKKYCPVHDMLVASGVEITYSIFQA